MLLSVSSCFILLTLYLGYRSGQLNLTDRVFNQLTSVRASKAYQIKSYFKTIRNHTETLSENPSVIAAMAEFDAAHLQLQSRTLSPYDQGIHQDYQTQFLPRLAKVEEGTPILESDLP